MAGPTTENYEALDAGAHVSAGGAAGTVTLLTRTGPVVIRMQRPVLEQLRYAIERELGENPLPGGDADREIS